MKQTALLLGVVLVFVALLYVVSSEDGNIAAVVEPEVVDTAIFAGGCFWCVEADFDKVPGVAETVSGYSGGHLANPTYEQVSAGGTGHAEVVQITFDPGIVSYAQLLDVFWHSIDVTDPDGQFCDRGDQYRSAIFATTPEQENLARESKAALMKSKPFAAPIVTEISPAGVFYPAEDYHQDYYHKNPIRYNFYRFTCGRDERLEELWGDDANRISMDG